ncbi:MAG: MBL fold metallo-hydrolase [Ruminococcus sp.]|nr:MBL fold metallo-hydrolase [Ruminococcus sp.]
MITVTTFQLGVMSTNTYVITDKATGATALVDPAGTDDSLTKHLQSLGKDAVKYILLTHGHFDHIAGARFYADMFSAKIVISLAEEPFLHDNNLNLSAFFGNSQLACCNADITVKGGDKLMLGESEFQFILTPGHTCGSGCYVFPEDRIIFSGDTLFFRSMGRVDFPTGNPSQMITSLHRLRDMQGDYKVYPGHDRPTSLEDERHFNPYFNS